MKMLVSFALLVLSGCASVDRVGPYEVPARNAPRMTVQPVTLHAVNRASECNGTVVDGVCYGPIAPEGKIGAATANAGSATGE